jgi:hypothetical protein
MPCPVPRSRRDLAATVDQSRQVIGHRHLRKRADPGTTGITPGNPNSREDKRRQGPGELTADFSDVSPFPAKAQHSQMRCRVRKSESLTQNVGTLQMLECRVRIAS